MPRIRQRGTARRPATLLGALGALAIVASAIFGISAVLAAPPLPSPTITSQPANPTKSRTAAFAFSDKQSVTFSCVLDAGPATNCGTGTTTGTANYSNVPDGSHTFQVTAKSGSTASNATTYTWSIDSAAPVVSGTFPANGGSYNAAGWTFCSNKGAICGSASDPSGVSQVQVSIQSTSGTASGKYWNGSAFASSTLFWNLARGTTSWSYGLSMPPDGTYTLGVQATDALGNVGLTSLPFSIDTAPPATPSITTTPDNPTFATSATFTYTDSEAGFTFQCELDKASFTPCPASGVTYSGLSTQSHTFQVEAVDPAGNASASASFTWTILANTPFTVTGTLSGRFAPGVTQSVNLRLTNPYNFSIHVVSVSISVDSGTTETTGGAPNPGCVGPDNLKVTTPFSATPQAVIVPANSTASLSGLGIAAAQWPQLTMPDLATNQDACQGTTFHLTYAGSATK